MAVKVVCSDATKADDPVGFMFTIPGEVCFGEVGALYDTIRAQVDAFVDALRSKPDGWGGEVRVDGPNVSGDMNLMVSLNRMLASRNNASLPAALLSLIVEGADRSIADRAKQAGRPFEEGALLKHWHGNKPVE